MAKKASRTRSKKSAGKPKETSPRVLIADDDVKIVRSLEGLFKTRGFRVSCANSVDQALRLVRKTQFELIIVDMRMPERNGGKDLDGDAGLLLVRLLMRFGLKPKGSILVVFTAYPSVAQCFAATDANAYYLPKTLPGMKVTEQLVDECARLVNEARKRKSQPKQSWLGEHYDELMNRFGGKTIAVVGLETAKKSRLKGGTAIGDRMVFTARTPEKLRDWILADPHFRRALPLLIDLS